jgi:deazaflavin-dependent oxidoreductase (nitroreductase family)
LAVLPEAVRRWLYRGGHASRLARLLNGAQARLAAAGVEPGWLVTVEVTGRRSGKTISFPAVIADYDNGRYLVSMLGEDTNWVRNVRASGGRAVLRHGDREPVTLQDVEVERRAPILRCCLQRAPGARAHIPVDRRAPVEAFEPIAAQYPVFRITAADGAGHQ